MSTFWDMFVLSPLGVQHNLSKLGLSGYVGSSSVEEWDGAGDFYGSAAVLLSRKDGTRFIWRIGVLFEQGKYEGVPWQQGGPYLYVSVELPDYDDRSVSLYSLGSANLPCKPFGLADLPLLAERILPIAVNCFQDLEFVCHGNHFNALLELAQQRINGHDEWESNPLRSSL